MWNQAQKPLAIRKPVLDHDSAQSSIAKANVSSNDLQTIYAHIFNFAISVRGSKRQSPTRIILLF